MNVLYNLPTRGNEKVESALQEKPPTFDLKNKRWIKNIPFAPVQKERKTSFPDVHITKIIYQGIVRKLACSPFICRAYGETEKKQ